MQDFLSEKDAKILARAGREITAITHTPEGIAGMVFARPLTSVAPRAKRPEETSNRCIFLRLSELTAFKSAVLLDCLDRTLPKRCSIGTKHKEHFMANSIRNILTIYGPLDVADRFIGRFSRGGMEKFAPIPSNPDSPRNYSEKSIREAWGACPEYGDFEILTETSIVAGQLGDDERRPHIKSIDAAWMNYNTFTLADHHREILALDLPGFLGQDKTPVALIVFHTKWCIPNRWIEAVINAEYPRGLVLHMQSYDVTANAEMYEYGSSCDHFHSYTAAAGTQYIQSGNCAILIRIESAPISAFDEMNDGDYDPTLPAIDDEGNELLDQSITVAAEPISR